MTGAAQAVGTDRLAILMYHRVAPTGSPALRAYRVTPEAFEEQLRYLRGAGYSSIRLEDWQAAMAKQKPLLGRAVVITFDDGYRDFLTYAWPLLKHYGFSATVFLVVDEMGRSSHWDRFHGEEAPLLGWREIWQLQSEGVEFGSHILERELKRPIQAFAYPYGAVDQVVEHLIGACGYVFGLSCQPRLSSFQDSLLMLPRIGVTGDDSLRDFVVQLSR
jgi:peptidoglycan/xylan/chitin deacetylase (PgdA/CDA1 family)